MLNEQIGSDVDFKEIFLNLLIQELTKAKRNIERATEEKNILETKIILHKLKSITDSAGLLKLSEYALKWEKMTENEMDFFLMGNEIKQEIKIVLDIIKNLTKQSL